MKKFKFTLQTVHDVREMREEKELLVLSQLNLEAERASRRLAEVEGALGAAVETYYRGLKTGEPIDAAELEENSKHISALEQQKAEAREKLRERRNASAAQIAVVAHAQQQVKVTGSLRENQVRTYRQGAARQEQNALDEMVTTGFARKLGESR